jgi:hypothetical protein
MDTWDVGRDGEHKIRTIFEKNKIHYLQADMLAKINGKWHSIEIKHQDKFTPPPFFGHGLPRWQIDARLELQKDTGIVALLFVLDKATKEVFWQYMDRLMDGKRYQTTGSNPRVIFPIESFILLDKLEILPKEWSNNA